VANLIYTSRNDMFVSSSGSSAKDEITPDDCSTTLVLSVLISIKYAGRLEAVPDPPTSSEPDAADDTIVL
jgi:hypothetical protein